MARQECLPKGMAGDKVSANVVLRKLLMIRAIYILSLVALLQGCSSFPEVDAAQAEYALTSGKRATPALVPIDGLIAQAVPGRATADARDALAARATGLRARAVAMRGPVHSPATRARLAAAIAAYPTKFD